MSDAKEKSGSWLATFINVGKDFVALLRDGALFILAMLLVLFPAQFNAILVDAGFEEGSVVGFKWKAKLVESNQALEAAQEAISTLQSKNDELLKALGEANQKADDPALFGTLEKLEAENLTLKGQTQIVQANVSQTIESNIPLVEKVRLSERTETAIRSRSDYRVGLQTMGVNDSERIKLNEQIRTEGYGLDPITWSYPANQRPAWFAPRSTVFFYSPASQATANELARFMKSATGQEFSVQRGASLGVDPSRKSLTLFIHYVRG